MVIARKKQIQNDLRKMRDLADGIWIPLSHEAIVGRTTARLEQMANGWAATLDLMIEQIEWEIQADMRDASLAHSLLENEEDENGREDGKDGEFSSGAE